MIEPDEKAPFDRMLTNVRIRGADELVDVGVRGGRIATIGHALPRSGIVEDGNGRLLFPGFVECHIHLDKAGILDRCPICAGTLEEAVGSVKAAKAAFTREDVALRAAKVIESSICHGTIAMRSFVEVDQEAGLRAFEALVDLRARYAHAIDLQICAFAQDGTTGLPGSLDLLAEALGAGADMVGGCPYTDADPDRHIMDIFDLAERFGTLVDFHLDFSLDPERTHLPRVIEETRRRGFAGRVTLGHVTNLSMMAPDRLRPIAAALAGAGIAVAALPATDLFLMGRDHDHAVPRGIAPLAALGDEGVRTAIASNNVLNPFTPFGNASLMRMADLYLHAAQLRSDAELEKAFDLLTSGPAAILHRPHDLTAGAEASFVLLDAANPVEALRTMALPVAGWYKGNPTFRRPPTQFFAGRLPAQDQTHALFH